jgi:hypothetical protein
MTHVGVLSKLPFHKIKQVVIEATPARKKLHKEVKDRWKASVSHKNKVIKSVKQRIKRKPRFEIKKKDNRKNVWSFERGMEG